MRAVTEFYEGPFSTEAVETHARKLREALETPAHLAFVFVSEDYLPHLAEFTDIIRVDGRISEVVGCSGSGLIANQVECETGSGFSILALCLVDDEICIVEQGGAALSAGVDSGSIRRMIPGVKSSVLLANPFHFPVDDWLSAFNEAYPRVPVMGGLASGGQDEASMAVFHNGRKVEGAVWVGFRGAVQVVPVVSQGCRPIGEPLPVTKSDQNVVFSLGSRPAYQALESAFESLSDSEKSTAQGNLFAGLANNEYVDEFKPGDFLIRNIIGADPDSGAVVIAGIPRLGQTMQYQLRDGDTADSDLRAVLKRSWSPAHGRLLGSLVFTCTGRGERMFGSPNHDAETLQEAAGTHSSAGFFCNGEIGPVAERNCVHGYTASIAMLCTNRMESPASPL